MSHLGNKSLEAKSTWIRDGKGRKELWKKCVKINLKQDSYASPEAKPGPIICCWQWAISHKEASWETGWKRALTWRLKTWVVVGRGGVLSQPVLSSIWPQFPDLQSGLLKQMITEKASNSKYSNSRHNFKEQSLIADYNDTCLLPL